MHLAQFNISKERFPIDHPAMRDFIDQLALVNRLADQADGFAWRLHDESGNATAMRVFEDKTIIFNLSVWKSVEALKEFTFKSAHAAMLRRRREWFEQVPQQTYVLWWIPVDGQPSIEEAKERLRYIQQHGPSPYAFTFDSVPIPPLRLMPEYLTERYRSTDLDRALFLIEHYPLATLVPEKGAACGFAFAPVIIERIGAEQFELVGHIDNCNPFLPQLDGSRMRAVFHGPNAYISPSDYVSDQFPTWNYAIVEAVGVTSLVRDQREKLEWMIRMVDRLERANGSSYRLDPSDSRVAGLIRRITFFRVEVEAVTGLFKFAQEKSFADRIRAHDSLISKSQRTLERVLPQLADDLDKLGGQRPLAETGYGG